mgnify:CR=1 FL=1
MDPGCRGVHRELADADLDATDALVTDDTWATLAGELDRQQLMDVVFTVGSYDLLAMAFRTFGVELDDDLKAWAAEPGPTN